MRNEIVKESNREVKTFAELMHGADSMLEKALGGIEGSYYCVMSSLLLCAFSFEAYMNHLGVKHRDLWTKEERLRVLDKYTLLCQELGIKEPDFGRGDDQRLKQLFAYRDTMAHGETYDLELKKPVKKASDDMSYTLKSDWENFTSVPMAEKCLASVQGIINRMNEAAGLGEYAFASGIEVSDVEYKVINKSRNPDAASSADS
ncbi:MAG: hypothetical protein CSH37_07850 [Thalassolituus sp.]|jgi:hypothetical protein|nr:MAG: hypothetical protein CSH37_07850 [Thalassolituus sp.]|tara:strand:+ start:425 stop:1033 length:609 start_codon:yes stop_codon:yes gene_type:complete